MANVNYLFDQYSSEDYLCNKTKPKGILICSNCHEPHEWMCGYEYGSHGDIGYSVCSKCGSMNDPYEED